MPVKIPRWCSRTVEKAGDVAGWWPFAGPGHPYQAFFPFGFAATRMVGKRGITRCWPAGIGHSFPDLSFYLGFAAGSVHSKRSGTSTELCSGMIAGRHQLYRALDLRRRPAIRPDNVQLPEKRKLEAAAAAVESTIASAVATGCHVPH